MDDAMPIQFSSTHESIIKYAMYIKNDETSVDHDIS